MKRMHYLSLHYNTILLEYSKFLILSVLLQEVIVEGTNLFDDFLHALFRRQDGGSEMESAILLAETRPWNNNNAGLLDQLHAVHFISSSTLTLSFCDGFCYRK